MLPKSGQRQGREINCPPCKTPLWRTQGQNLICDNHRWYPPLMDTGAESDLWSSQVIYYGIYRTTQLFCLPTTDSSPIIILSNNQLVQHITYHLLTYEWYIFSNVIFLFTLISARLKQSHVLYEIPVSYRDPYSSRNFSYNCKTFHTMKKSLEAQIRVISYLSQPQEISRISPQT